MNVAAEPGPTPEHWSSSTVGAVEWFPADVALPRRDAGGAQLVVSTVFTGIHDANAGETCFNSPGDRVDVVRVVASVQLQ
jgi:hypothetical protein